MPDDRDDWNHSFPPGAAPDLTPEQLEPLGLHRPAPFGPLPSLRDRDPNPPEAFGEARPGFRAYEDQRMLEEAALRLLPAFMACACARNVVDVDAWAAERAWEAAAAFVLARPAKGA